jgi:nascent polypeptide-associated complex subunit alpha
MNPRQMKAMMKRMGIAQEDIEDVEEIIIKTRRKDYVFHEAMVSVMTVQGQKSFQIVGEPEIIEKAASPSKPESAEEDVKLVMEQTGVSEEEARAALDECGGQPAEAILKIMSAR